MSSVIGQKKGQKLTLINPLKPNGLADEPFAKFRAADSIFHFFPTDSIKLCKQILKILIRRRTMRLMRFCTICRCPIKRTIGLNGLKCFLIYFLLLSSIFANEELF